MDRPPRVMDTDSRWRTPARVRFAPSLSSLPHGRTRGVLEYDDGVVATFQLYDAYYKPNIFIMIGIQTEPAVERVDVLYTFVSTITGSGPGFPKTLYEFCEYANFQGFRFRPGDDAC